MDRSCRKINLAKIIFFHVILIGSVFIFAELSFSVVFFKKDRKVSFLFKPIFLYLFSVQDTHTYGIPWDSQRDRMWPGSYRTKEGIEYRINSFGFRGKEFDPLNKEGRYRIICLGGSSTLGLESPEDDTYPAILERLLKDFSINAEVLNFGVPSKSLKYIQKLISLEASRYKPNLITIKSCRNTVLYDSVTYYGYQESFSNAFNYRLMQIHNCLNENLMSWLVLSSFCRKLALVLHKGDIRIGDFKTNEDFFRREYCQKIKSIIEFGRNNGCKICLIKEPLYLNPELQMKIKDYGIDRLIGMMRDQDYSIYKSKFYPDNNDATKFWILTSTIINNQIDYLKSIYSDLLVVDPVNDLLGKGVDQELLFNDYVHLKPAGNSVLAKSIFALIKSEIKKCLKTKDREDE